MQYTAEDRSVHSRRQLGYGIILLISATVLAFLIRLYIIYAPLDSGGPLSLASQIGCWAIPLTWFAAAAIGFISSYRIARGAEPTLLRRYSALLCLVGGAAANLAMAGVFRLVGAL
jgi:hypothetical protein